MKDINKFLKQKPKKIKKQHLLVHKTKKEVLIKFILLFFVLLAYFLFLTWKFNIVTGGVVAILTWSFFVLCTPIADAGFLLDFPLRLLFGVRMFISELFVWLIAIGVNIIILLYYSDFYEATFLTSLFKKILLNPYPYWIIILLSAVGTFFSVVFGDELLDIIKHKDRKMHHTYGFKHQLIVFGVIFLLTIWSYYHFLETLNIKIDH